MYRHNPEEALKNLKGLDFIHTEEDCTIHLEVLLQQQAVY